MNIMILLLKPSIELSENIFKIVLPNKNYIEKNNINLNAMSQKDSIIQYVKNNNKITRLDVERILNIGNTRSKQLIKELLDNNILLKMGNGKNTFYVLKQ